VNGVNEFVQPRIFYARIISLYLRLWLIARVSHDILCIHAVRKYENFPALVRNVGIKYGVSRIFVTSNELRILDSKRFPVSRTFARNNKHTILAIP
jgi:hypothetical protein